MAGSHKSEKEAFVSNLNGGSIWEIHAITLVPAVSVLLWSTLQSRESFFTPYSYPACVVDILVNCVAPLFATTIYSANSVLLNVLLLTPSILAVISSGISNRSATRTSRQRLPARVNGSSTQAPENLPTKPFLTHYRATMMIGTCAAILAVDFKVFPRRFAKVENWGTSLMDLGVGSFVFSAGTISARPILKSRQRNRSVSLAMQIRAALRHALPLFVLGLIRLYSVKGLDYAEHVTEYGVHWNFFFTLAFVPPFVALCDVAFAVIPSYAALAIIISCVYELLLDYTDLKSFIMTAPRTDLFSKNREGIFSFLGYLSIFLIGQSTGLNVLPNPPQRTDRFRDPILRHLLLWSIVWSTLFIFCISYKGFNLQVSRRLANLPYVLWTAAFNTGYLALFCAIENLCFPSIYDQQDRDVGKVRLDRATSKLLKAVNRNGLAIFLAANLLTGLVNLTLPTLHLDDVQAMGVLVAYIAILAGFALGLDRANISIKL